MELVVALSIGVLTAAGTYLVLRLRAFPVIVGLTLLSYATNVFVFSSGRLAVGVPPVLNDSASTYTDPLPQALVLTAIVIPNEITMAADRLALGAFLESGDDQVNVEDKTTGEGDA